MFDLTCDTIMFYLVFFFMVFPFVLTNFTPNFTVKEVSEQSRELLRQALEEAQAELSRKFEIIHEIRAIESLPHIRVIRNFDDTEVSEGERWRHLAFHHVLLCVAVDLLSRVRPQATSCWGRCPWSS